MIALIASFLMPACAVMGMWLQANRNRFGWMVNASAQILWFSFGLYTHQYGFAFSAPLFFVLNLRGWIKWRPSDPGHCDLCRQKIPVGGVSPCGPVEEQAS